MPQAGCVLHCFGEDRATMERFVELGCYIAYGGAATFKRNDEVREALRQPHSIEFCSRRIARIWLRAHPRS
ncbi:MAG: TatD family hydrolase [Collinsella sp.]